MWGSLFLVVPVGSGVDWKLRLEAYSDSFSSGTSAGLDAFVDACSPF
jgi:hypothetical protein